ncbi:MAG: hypothetical protein ACLFU9_05715 [Candidatus Bathyarchaeia archaeon]
MRTRVDGLDRSDHMLVNDGELTQTRDTAGAGAYLPRWRELSRGERKAPSMKLSVRCRGIHSIRDRENF